MPMTSEQFLLHLKQLMKDMHSTHVTWSVRDADSVVSQPLSKHHAKDLQDRLMRDGNPDIMFDSFQCVVAVKHQSFTSLWEKNQSLSTKSLLEMHEAEWQAAETFFSSKDNQAKGKFRKKSDRDGEPYVKSKHKLSLLNPDPRNVRHSFVYIDGKIYRIANGEYKVASGMWGDFKVVQDRQGKVSGIKLYNPETIDPQVGHEQVVGRRVGLLKGQMQRKITDNEGKVIKKRYKGEESDSKGYLLMKYMGDTDLNDVIEKVEKKYITPEYWLPIMMECANHIQALHDARIIHGDIKYGNFLVDTENEHYPVGLVDFGFSLPLEPGENHRFLTHSYGTEEHMTHELKQGTGPYRYSFETDVHALGIMFQDVGMCTNMTSHMLNSFNRLPLSDVRSAIFEDMQRRIPESSLSPHAKRLMVEFKKENQELIQWLAEKSGVESNKWDFQHANSARFFVMRGSKLPEGVEDKLKVLSADCVHKSLIRTGFYVDKLRSVMIREKRQKVFEQIVLAMKQQSELSVFSIESKAVKSMGDCVVLTASPELATLMQQALNQLEIPFVIQDANNNKQICILDFVLTMVDHDPALLVKQIAERFKVYQTLEVAAPAVESKILKIF